MHIWVANALIKWLFMRLINELVTANNYLVTMT